MNNKSGIVYEKGSYWVREAEKGAFEVYRVDNTHSVRCATIGKGPAPKLGITRAIAECDKRAAV